MYEPLFARPVDNHFDTRCGRPYVIVLQKNR